jgi:hypothetical protein
MCCVFSPLLVGNGSVKVPLSLLGNGGNEYKRNNRKIVGRVIFSVIRVVSRKVGDWFFPELLVYYKSYFSLLHKDITSPPTVLSIGF